MLELGLASLLVLAGLAGFATLARPEPQRVRATRRRR
jgi:hypothetical protein